MLHGFVEQTFDESDSRPNQFDDSKRKQDPRLGGVPELIAANKISP